MQNQTHFSFTTRRAAEVAGVEKHVLLTALQRHGNWRGIVPIKLPSGHLRWPAAAVYQAAGQLPQGRATPATQAREHVCAHTDADPFQSQKVLDHLFSSEPQGNDPAGRFAHLFARVQHLIDHADAVAGLARATMHDEDNLSADDARRLRWLADCLEVAADNSVRPLLWRAAPAQPRPASMFAEGPGGAQ